MMTVAAFAKDKNHHTVDIPETVKVGAGQLAPGKYTMEWSESEPTAEITFLQEGLPENSIAKNLRAMPAARSQIKQFLRCGRPCRTRTLDRQPRFFLQKAAPLGEIQSVNFQLLVLQVRQRKASSVALHRQAHAAGDDFE